MIKANGPQTYVPTKQPISEVSSFEQLTTMNNLINDERLKKALKSKTE
jgi:hypothetical protein